MVNKINCWEYIKCDQKECHAFSKTELLCWTVGGNRFCLKNLEPAEMIKQCLQCGVFKNNIQIDTPNGFTGLINQLYRELEKSEGQLILFRKISSLIQSTIELDKILHIILNCVTAGYGLGFNRALLLLINEKENILEGIMGVAPASHEEASRIWNNLSNLDVTSDNLTEIVDIYEKKFQTRDTDIDNIVKQIKIPLQEDNIFSSCINNKKGIICDSRYKEKTPESFIRLWGTDYFAVTPLIARNKVLGIIIADNFFNNKPITNEYLELLSGFAYHAGLAIENARLFEKLEKESIEIQKTNERLKEVQEILMRAEKLSVMGEMAATVAHEMRSPLISIGGFARILRENLKKDPENLKYFEIIIEEVNRLEKIIKDVLDFVKPFKLTLTDINIKKIIEEIITFFNIGAKRENIVLKDELNNDLPVIKGDAERLKQVFINIMENAFDAMPKGGDVTIIAGISDGFVNVEFKDTGLGIKDEYFDKVTKPFFTTKSDGIGLGLSIADKIIKEHKGKLQIFKNETQGVTFKVSLPC